MPTANSDNQISVLFRSVQLALTVGDETRDMTVTPVQATLLLRFQACHSIICGALFSLDGLLCLFFERDKNRFVMKGSFKKSLIACKMLAGQVMQGNALLAQYKVHKYSSS